MPPQFRLTPRSTTWLAARRAGLAIATIWLAATPAWAQKMAEGVEGFAVDVIYWAPDVEHPVAVACDDRGGVYVGEDPMDMRGPTTREFDRKGRIAGHGSPDEAKKMAPNWPMNHGNELVAGERAARSKFRLPERRVGTCYPRAELVRSVLEPSNRVAASYQVTTITTDAGSPEFERFGTGNPEETGVVVIGVYAPDDLAAVEASIKRRQWDCPVMIDRQVADEDEAPGLLASEFKVTEFPHSFVIDREGRIAGHGSPDEAMKMARELADKPRE